MEGCGTVTGSIFPDARQLLNLESWRYHDGLSGDNNVA